MMDPNPPAAEELEVPVEPAWEIAGVGSRMFAGLFDAGLLLGLWLIATVLSLYFVAHARAAAADLIRHAVAREWTLRGVDGAGVALLASSILLSTSGFYIVAELASGGRSPGKRAFGLRVIRQNGEPIGIAHTVVRNVLRAVDWFPGAYGVGLVASVASSRTQRLGDMAAGTIVVRERPRGHVFGGASGLAVGRLGSLLAPDEMALLADFWARAPMLSPDARTRLARQIAPLLRARLADASSLDAESFLWALLRDGGGEHAPP